MVFLYDAQTQHGSVSCVKKKPDHERTNDATSTLEVIWHQMR